MRFTLEETLKKSGVETEIRNLVFHLVREKFQTEMKANKQIAVALEQNVGPSASAQVADPVSTSQNLTVPSTSTSISANSRKVIANYLTQALSQKASTAETVASNQNPPSSVN